jgi:Cys-tRNA(Pro)/Cys-tRNA(Cys) deacylase
MKKTNAIRLIEAGNFRFNLRNYEFNPHEIDAVSVALKIGAEPERVFKTLVARGDKNGVCVFVIPGNYSLNLRKAANSSGNKKIEMVKEKELLPLTGYVKGGCSPVGMKKIYPTLIDETAELWDSVFVSAGIRGLQVEMSPYDLKSMIPAEWADLI